ncbi:MAG: DEAD/DEAH box helicase [Spirochaetaceae bacterium]|nr:DEAD/DEAH box helicase [Spirochaetaceae bacterium]
MEPDSGFDALGLSPPLLDSLKAAGLREPFPVQTEAIPLVLARRDLLARAPTGSGKTIAFGAPILQNLLTSARRTAAGSGRSGTQSLRALVLVPTRELAAQVGEVTLRLARRLPFRIKVCVAAGGVSVNPQMMALRGGADFLVATPGRLLDLVGRHAVSLSALEILVLDEADRLLDLGFRDELDRIRVLLPAARQTLLFSATFDAEIETLAGKLLRSPVRIEAAAAPPEPRGAASDARGGAETVVAASGGSATESGAAEADTSSLEERGYAVPNEEKGPFLRRLIAERPEERVLVFVSSNRRADNVTRKLANNGIGALALHGDLSQGARTSALDSFKTGRVRVLVASDLASRGLDIPALDRVVNYELPRSPLDYVHRVGRTGRAGRPGLAISLVSPEEEAMWRLIGKRRGRRIELVPWKAED